MGDSNLELGAVPELGVGKKSRKRKKRPGNKRTSKMKREATKGSKGAAQNGDDAGARGGQGGAAATGSGNKKKKSQEGDGHDKELDNRVFVGGLPDDADEQSILEHFGACGTVRSVKLIRNSRLIFRGSAFVSFKKEPAMTAALDLDGTEFSEKKITVKKAAAPVAPPDFKVYVAGLPWKATEEVLRKDFEECGEIAKIHLLKDMDTKKFKGVMFVTYKSQAGVDAALKFHDTEYGGKLILVRLASAKPDPGSKPPAALKIKRAREQSAEEVEVPAEEAAADEVEVPAKVKRKRIKDNTK